MDFTEFNDFEDFLEKTGLDEEAAFNFLKRELERRGLVMDKKCSDGMK